MSKSSLEGIETPKLCPRQTFKELESRNQAFNKESRRTTRVQILGGGGGGGSPPPLSGRAWGDVGGSDKDFWSSLCSNEKA